MNYFWLFALIDLIPVILVIYSNPLRGLSRALAPDTLVVIMLYAVFAVRPLFTQRFLPSTTTGSGFYGLVPSLEGQLTASTVGTLLLASIAIGAFWQTRRRLRNPLAGNHESKPVLSETGRAHLHPGRAILITGLALTLYVGILASFMGLAGVLALTGGRSKDAEMDFVPEAVTLLPLAGSIASAVLILNARGRPINYASWSAIVVCTAASLFAVSQLGARRYIIPSILIVVTALLMRRPTRLRFWHAALGAVGVLILAVLPYVRSAGGRVAGESLIGALVRSISNSTPLDAGTSFFTSYDTQMYDYLAILASEMQNGYVQLGWGRGTLVEFIAHPFPSSLTPFVERTGELKIHIFNYSCFGVDCPAPNPVLSAGGAFFLDGWYIGVLIGGIILGLIVREVSYRWERAATLTTSQNIITATIASYAMIAVRTDTVVAVWWVAYTLLVAVFVLVAMGEWGISHGRVDRGTGESQFSRARSPRESGSSQL